MRQILIKNLSKVLIRVWAFACASQRIRRYVLAILSILGLYDVARLFYWRLDTIVCRSDGRGIGVKDKTHLTPGARRIYADLKAAIPKNQESR